jgi:phosphoglycolate phosphatase-like HAD superfamily hydrolase
MKYIAFDMDGTLYDCGGIIGSSYTKGIERCRNELGLEISHPTQEQIRSVLGMTADHFFPVLFPGIEPSRYPLIDRIMTEELSSDVRTKGGTLYDGVSDLLKALAEKGWKSMIASNGQYKYLNAIIETYALTPFFVHGANPTVVNYHDICTKSDILASYVKDLGIDKERDRFIMVGDRGSDMKAARDNGAFFIGCAFGHAEDSEIRGADEIVHSFGGISALLEIF